MEVVQVLEVTDDGLDGIAFLAADGKSYQIVADDVIELTEEREDRCLVHDFPFGTLYPEACLGRDSGFLNALEMLQPCKVSARTAWSAASKWEPVDGD